MWSLDCILDIMHNNCRDLFAHKNCTNFLRNQNSIFLMLFIQIFNINNCDKFLTMHSKNLDFMRSEFGHEM